VVRRGRQGRVQPPLGARRFSDALKALKIRHTHEEHAFGHFDMNDRLDKSLPLLAARLRRIG
jgi:hypothetical protein